jgi:hypothetical protein
MALPTQLRHAPTPQELEYITGEIIVSIEPLFRMEKVRLVSVSASTFQMCFLLDLTNKPFRVYMDRLGPLLRPECQCGSPNP